MRLIDADELAVDVLRITIVGPAVAAYADAVLCLMQRAPTIDAEPVRHGTWKLLPNGDGICDQCHVILKNVWDEDGWLHFCSCCGAKMDGGVSDE